MATSKSESHINKIMGKIDSASTITSADNSSTLTSTSRDYIKGTRWEAMDNQVDQNLGKLLYLSIGDKLNFKSQMT